MITIANMIPKLFKRRHSAGAQALYDAIVAQARLPAFYRDLQVPDTVSGRFDMVLLHVFLVMNRFGARPEHVETTGQAVFDLFLADMDANLRELGISDLSVPKKMKRVGEAFYGRSKAYMEAFAADDQAQLAEALGRNLYPDGHAPADAAGRLAAYAFAARLLLDEQVQGALARGRIDWPNPVGGSADRGGGQP